MRIVEVNPKEKWFPRGFVLQPANCTADNISSASLDVVISILVWSGFLVKSSVEIIKTSSTLGSAYWEKRGAVRQLYEPTPVMV